MWPEGVKLWSREMWKWGLKNGNFGGRKHEFRENCLTEKRTDRTEFIETLLALPEGQKRSENINKRESKNVHIQARSQRVKIAKYLTLHPPKQFPGCVWLRAGYHLYILNDKLYMYIVYRMTYVHFLSNDIVLGTFVGGQNWASSIQN